LCQDRPVDAGVAPEAPPRVSVVVPTRNRAAVLPRALRSVLAQTVGDFELVVVDDGSDDGTAAVQAAVVDPRVVWLTGPHAGVSVARNTGIAAARGAWVAFLDDDNEWEPEYLAHQLSVAAASGAAVVSCLGVDVDPDGSEHPQAPPPDPDPLRAGARGWWPFTSATMVRRVALLDVGGFPPEFSHGEDVHVWAALALGRSWARTPDRLLVRHRHDQPRLTDDWPAYREAARALDRRYGAAVARRAGLTIGMRWYWQYVGRFAFARMLLDAQRRGRRVVGPSIWRSMRALPRSSTTIGRSVLVLVLGPVGYRRVAGRYDRAHPRRAGRRRT
jgi:glycosyltransferase involved in cell wall biosynthesis